MPKGKPKYSKRLSDGTCYPPIPDICWCGECNEIVYNGKRYIKQHQNLGKSSWNKDKPWSEEVKNKLSESNSKSWTDLEVRKKYIDALTTSSSRLEVKERRSKAMKKVWSDVSRRNRLSEKQKIIKNLPEAKQKTSERMRLIANDPLIIAKINATKKANYVRKIYTLEDLIHDYGEIPFCSCSECQKNCTRVLVNPDEYGSYSQYKLYGYPKYISGHNLKDNNRGMLGKHHTIETIEKLSIANSGINNNMYDVHMCKERHWNWQGGKSYEVYGIDFDDNLKEQVRLRDSHTCQLCSRTQKDEIVEYNNRLKIHHIDYNKKNNNKDNLITLCLSCHTKTNYYRRYYEEYFVLFIQEVVNIGD